MERNIFSKRSSMINPSPLKEFFKRVKEAERKNGDILSLGIGDLNLDTPGKIKKEAIKAIKSNRTHYVPESGSADLKEAIAEKYGCKSGEVIISSGAKPVIGAVLWSIIDKNDAVLVPSPYYPPFVEVLRSLEAGVVFIDTKKDGFQLSAKNIEQSIKRSGKTPKALIINSPNNPTGIEYKKTELEKIIELGEKHGFVIISDECYSHYSSDHDFTLRDLSSDVIAINSVSKTYAMTGWRIGWGVMPEEIARRATLYLENYIGCPNSIAERAAIKALSGNGADDFRRQRKALFDWLDKMGARHPMAESGIYAFADFSKYIDGKKIKNSSDLAEYLLQKGIAVTPGKAFGNYPNHLRLSYCVDETYLNRAISRMEEALGKL